VLPPKEKPKDEIKEMVLHLQKEAEDLELKEWKCLQRRQKYGKLREICGEQYMKEVTNVSSYSLFSSIPVCLLVNEHLSLLAKNLPEVKFLKAIVNSCIPNYHDRCLPTILYIKLLEWKLAEVGAIETNLEENPKKDIMNMIALSVRNMKTQIQRAVM
uniref:Phosducin like 2 n=1 Tax=Strix occidentalis caurina TaxID=311401 RepID=A0A8D0ES03_STROC